VNLGQVNKVISEDGLHEIAREQLLHWLQVNINHDLEIHNIIRLCGVNLIRSLLIAELPLRQRGLNLQPLFLSVGLVNKVSIRKSLKYKILKNLIKTQS
jgi:hypothetical protein